MSCGRCGGEGTVKWCGKGPDARIGPCPVCQVEGAKRFCSGLAAESFPLPTYFTRANRFTRNFTGGESHG